jgi:hypothetical protein
VLSSMPSSLYSAALLTARCPFLTAWCPLLTAWCHPPHCMVPSSSLHSATLFTAWCHPPHCTVPPPHCMVPPLLSWYLCLLQLNVLI